MKKLTIVIVALTAAVIATTDVNAQGRTTPFVADPGDTSQSYGDGLAKIADVNGDGRDDVAVGAPLWMGDITSPGRVEMIDGFSGALIWSVDGPLPQARLGGSLVAVEDLDGDGVDDLVASAFPGNGVFGTHVLHVLSGADGAQVGQITIQHHSVHPPAMALVEDHDGDGTREIALTMLSSAAPFVNSLRYMVIDVQDEVVLVNQAHGSIGILSLPPVPTSIAHGPDLDNDGVGEVAMGFALTSSNGLSINGSVSVVSGATGQILWKQDGIVNQGGLGASVAWVDHQGAAHVAAGAPGIDSGLLLAGPGSLLVINGTTGTITQILSAPPGVDEWGRSLDSIAAPLSPFLIVGCRDTDVPPGEVATVAQQIFTLNGQVMASWGVPAPTAGPGHAIGQIALNEDIFPDVVVAVDGAVGLYRSAGTWQYGTQNGITVGGSIQIAHATLVVSGGSPGAAAYIAIAVNPADTPFLGGQLLVDPSSIVSIQAGVLNALGVLFISMPGDNSSLLGYTFYVQAFSPELSAPQGISMSNGVLTTI